MNTVILGQMMVNVKVERITCTTTVQIVVDSVDKMKGRQNQTVKIPASENLFYINTNILTTTRKLGNLLFCSIMSAYFKLLTQIHVKVGEKKLQYRFAD